MNILTLVPDILETLAVVGDFVADQQTRIKGVSYKSVKDPQTNVDVEAEHLLHTKLKKLVPEAGFILEESGESRKERYNWTVDPIDGTKFYSTHYPQFFTQVALHDESEIVFSAIYQPIAKQMFHAVKGHGAFLNNTPITLAKPSSLSESIVNLEMGKIGDDPHKLQLMDTFAKKAHRLIILSGILAPYLLTDTTQAYIRFYEKIAPYDTASRLCLFQEAGAEVYVGLHHGKELIIAAHPGLMPEVKQLIFRSI